MRVKKKIVKTLVWTTLLYGSETWTLNEAEVKRLEAVEMWIWRRMEKISYVDRVTNEDVLIRIEEERRLVNLIRERKRNWIGHVVRGEGLLKDVIEGQMEGSKRAGAPRTKMFDELIVSSYDDMKRIAENRQLWRDWRPWDLSKEELKKLKEEGKKDKRKRCKKPKESTGDEIVLSSYETVKRMTRGESRGGVASHGPAEWQNT
jgi:hypothetical protein